VLQDALVFYELSGRFNHAVRLAKASGSDGQLMSLALQARSRPAHAPRAFRFFSPPPLPSHPRTLFSLLLLLLLPLLPLLL
jgi:hypothetical protein